MTGALAPAAAAAPDVPEGVGSRSGVSVDYEDSSRSETLAFWTPERLREAVPAPMPEGSAAVGGGRAEGSAPPAEELKVTASAPAVQPKSATTAGAQAAPDVQAAAEIAVSQRVPLTTTYPMNVVGKLFAYDANGDEQVKCSASVIISDTKNTIWTAAHCVHRGDGSGAAGFYEHLIFIPAYKAGESPWGIWTAKAKYAPEGYTDDSDNLESDLAAVVLEPEPDYGNIQDAMGALGYSFGSGSDYPEVTTVGYPAEGYNRTDLNGEYMYFCYGNAEDNANFNPLDNRIKMDCDMGKGASGGPLVIASEASGIQIVGANSHYLGDTTTGERANDDLLSSEHGVRAVNVINAVNDSV
ncbi:trypsin-like serine peptidase [Streptomyces sp. NPDC057539]|uniref:trypsin-like serine peptidase n=1 Tax=Streptomyces sp. NPDC057539 TaxID=3346159 RepID=UPI0036A1ED6C